MVGEVIVELVSREHQVAAVKRTEAPIQCDG